MGAPSAETLARHGLDFIESSVQRLSADDSEQQSREAVVILAVGIELVLKARLLSEHWSLVFKDINTARESNLMDGTLQSAGPEECLNRIRHICEDKVTPATESRFKDFWRFRNRIVHFVDHKISIDSLRSRAYLVLSELVDLTARPHFVPPELAPSLEGLRIALLSLASYVEVRGKEIKDLLRESGDASFCCTTCGQRAIVMREERSVCLFCRVDYSHYAEVAELHLEREHGYTWRDPRAASAIAHCLACEAWGDVVLERQGSGVMRCLQCWTTTDQSGLLRCLSCEHWYAAATAEAPQVCLDCRGPLIQVDDVGMS